MQDEINHLVGMYEQRSISRRSLVAALATLAIRPSLFSQSGAEAPTESLVRARTLNHVTLVTPEVARSRRFYQKLTGLPVRDEGKEFCEFRLEGAFLGIYAPDAGQPPGFNHFCLGIEAYEPKQLLSRLQQALPEAHPTLEYENQVYVRDPDGVRVQFADVTYKR